MIYFTVTYEWGRQIEESDIEIFYEILESLFSFYKNNGQVIEYTLTSLDEITNLETILLCPQANSLDSRYDNVHIIKYKQKIKDEFLVSLAFLQKGYHINSKNDLSMDDSDFVLKWGAFSPLRRLKDLIPYPLYYIPPTSPDKTNYQDIFQWQSNFESCYQLWHRGNIKESFFLDQMTNIRSDLNDQGRLICRKIADQTGKECYYYVFYEDRDLIPHFCPNCSRNWVSTDQHYKFKCNTCFIVAGERD